MRKIEKIIVHCTATPTGRETSVEEIRSWHLHQGFTDIGYHYVVMLDGRIMPGRDERVAGAHCKGQNARSIGVCYVGGLDKNGDPADTRTPAQKIALINLVSRLKRRFPGATVHGHREFAAKACPCFDAGAEYRDL